RQRAARRARRPPRGGRVAGRGARRPQGHRAGQGPPDDEGGTVGGRSVRAATSRQPVVGASVEGGRRAGRGRVRVAVWKRLPGKQIPAGLWQMRRTTKEI